MEISTSKKLTAILLVFMVSACTNDHYLIASTGTVIGLELSQNQATQAPQAKLGYNREEVAIVPTNRVNCKDKDKTCKPVEQGTRGAADTTDVLMELRYDGFSFNGSGGVYQRLAIGRNAVRVPGAAAMFIKNKDGSIDAGAAKALDRAFNAYGTENFNNDDSK